MRPVRELAVVANRSTGRGGAGDEREDEQEIFKALSLGECLLDGLRREKWRRGEEKSGGERKGQDRTGQERKGGIKWAESCAQNLWQTLS